MGRFSSGGLRLAVAILSFWSLAACGGGSKPGPPLFAGRVNLSPATNTSVVLGSTLNFSASVQTASGTNLNTTITYSSSDTSILNLASNGVGCAGHWDALFTTCTPGGTGVVQVTASALGATSVPTYVFVHPAVDNITVTGVLLDGVPVQEPCLSQSQTMTLEAHAFSHGADVTASVGPFTWSANNSTVVNLTPLVNSAYNFATNQVTAKAVNPGITRIFASASGVSSTSFQQPTYQQTINGGTQTSPVLDFFSTCPIQNISLELGAAGSEKTSFAITKGTGSTAETAIATVVDVMGNSSLPNTTGGIVLSKIPLTWTASKPQVLNVGTGCTQSCSLSIVSPGSGTVTASCSPPTCNVGFPVVPLALSPANVDACTNFFHAEFPQFAGCKQLIPVPVYSSPVFINPPNSPTQLSPSAAISGVISGAPVPSSVLAASTGCTHELPSTCSSAVYFLSTAKAAVGSENTLPDSPNSFLFDPAGDKILMGSDFGAQLINPTNFGSGSNPYSSLGSITGKAIATNNNGTVSVFSDTLHSPNQVYIVNGASSTSISASALNIPGATTAAFSPDGLKTFILGGAGGNSLYIYSPFQALQQYLPTTPPTNPQLLLSGPANSVVFSPNGAFAFVSESAANGNSANVTAFANCNNQVAATVPLPGNPLFMRILPNLHVDGRDSLGNPIPDGVHVLILDSTGFDIATSAVSPPASGTLCPQGLQFISGDLAHPNSVQRIELGQGTLQPLNFFISGDGTQLYVVNSSSSTILVYSFIAGSIVGGIELQGGIVPLSADISVDGSTIFIAGSDGMLHEVTTTLGGSDLVQLSFPNLPNAFNAFCTISPPAGPCILNTVVAKP
jgi:hypothetical protein